MTAPSDSERVKKSDHDRSLTVAARNRNYRAATVTERSWSVDANFARAHRAARVSKRSFGYVDKRCYSPNTHTSGRLR